jgi:hypothetical protein
MSLSDLLDSRATEITERWRSLTLAVYPKDTGRAMRAAQPFKNPVGEALTESLAELFKGLATGADIVDLHEPMDRIVRIRAVQDMRPSDAVGFVFFVKRAVRELLPEGGAHAAELADFESRVDELALLAFEIWGSCRNQLLRAQMRSVQRGSSHLLRLAKRLGDPAAKDMQAALDEPPANGGGQA